MRIKKEVKMALFYSVEHQMSEKLRQFLKTEENYFEQILLQKNYSFKEVEIKVFLWLVMSHFSFSDNKVPRQKLKQIVTNINVKYQINTIQGEKYSKKTTVPKFHRATNPN